MSEELRKVVDVEQLISITRMNVRDELRHLMAVHLTDKDGDSAKAVAAFIHKHWATVYMALSKRGDEA